MKIAEAESKDISNFEMMDEFYMIELKKGDFKTVRLSSVGQILADVDIYF